MSWFGGSSAPKTEKKSYDSDDSFSYNAPPQQSAASSLSASDEQLVATYQGILQQGMMQEVMLKLTTGSFQECISKPSSSLSCKFSNFVFTSA